MTTQKLGSGGLPHAAQPKPNSRTNLLNFPRPEFLSWMHSNSIGSRAASGVFRKIYAGSSTLNEDVFAELPAAQRARLAELAEVRLPEIVTANRSEDGLAQKFLLRLEDDALVETVLMHHDGRDTVCLSSQVGCAMGCVFCATGKLGFTRNLSTAEIVGQALVAAAHTAGRGLRNAVFMGMGEPLANYDAVACAIEILCDSGGFALRRKRVSVSTVGVVPGILRMAAEAHPPALAVSLHAASQAERAAIVPTARRWTLDVLLDACRAYSRASRNKVFFEWTLIRDRNDSPEIAQRLAALLRGMDAHVNLIFLNPSPAETSPPAEPALLPSTAAAGATFQRILREAGIPATFRASRGPDILAACGQLSATHRVAVDASEV